MIRRGVWKLLLAAGRLALCAALLVWLAGRLDFSVLGDALRQSAEHWFWWLAALGFTFLGLLAGVWRWRDILAAQGLRLPAGQVFVIFFIGQFFNAFMLGACGGDVARAYYVARRTAGRRTEAASTVLVDRAVGLWVTILFGCVMIGLHRDLFLAQPAGRAPAVLMGLLLAASVLAGVLLFRRNLIEHAPLLRRLEWTTRAGRLFRRVYEALYLYRHRPAVMARAVICSLLNLAFLTWACMAFGRSLGIEAPATVFFAFFPVITIMAAVPLTPGSLGVREGLFVILFQAVGVADELALSLSLMVYIGSLFWSLFGGLIFVGYAAGAGRRVRDDLNAIQHQPPEASP